MTTTVHFFVSWELQHKKIETHKMCTYSCKRLTIVWYGIDMECPSLRTYRKCKTQGKVFWGGRKCLSMRGGVSGSRIKFLRCPLWAWNSFYVLCEFWGRSRMKFLVGSFWSKRFIATFDKVGESWVSKLFVLSFQRTMKWLVCPFVSNLLVLSFQGTI